MKLKIISYSVSKGGAAKAAKNFLLLVNDKSQYQAELISVFGTLEANKFTRASTASIVWHYTKMLMSRFFTYFERFGYVVKYSLNLFSSDYVLHKLNCSSTEKEIIHLNWINNDTLSLRILKKLFNNPNKKILLTLHDEWFYCSTEHYAEFNEYKFIEGYDIANARVINRYIYNLKKKLNYDNIVITVPSRWLYERAKSSYLLKNADIHILPNYIDTEVFIELRELRRDRYKELGIAEGSFIIGFGAVNGSSNPLKGFDLLIEALQKVADSSAGKNKIILLTFGANYIDKRVASLGCKIINMGFIANSSEMVKVYNLLDVMIVPSRAESFGQVAAESLACQTPVIAFNYSGVRDIIIHQRNGLLAEPFSVESLTDSIKQLMNMSIDERKVYGENGRQDVVNKFGKDVISSMYLNLLDYVKGVTNE
ncbi:TPA: glycosyltransferase [Citrobacter amalonaticus]